MCEVESTIVGHDVETMDGMGKPCIAWAECIAAGNAASLCQTLLMCSLQRKRHDPIEHYPPCYDFSLKIFQGIKHVVVLTGTGAGKTQNMEVARMLMKTALNYRYGSLPFVPVLQG
jgi:hypothetical protein